MTFTNLGSHIRLVDAVRNAGGEVPAKWDQVRNRYTAMQNHGTKMTGRLARAVADPDDNSDIDALFAAACAGHWPTHLDTVLGRVQSFVFPALLRLYAPVATKNYKLLAGRFDDAAKDFTACTSVIDVCAHPDLVLDTADRRGIQAWKDAPAHARKMDELLGPLACAASLCGAEGDPGAPGFDHANLHIPLVVADAAHLHRRKLWNRWHCLPDTHPEPGPLTKAAYEAATADPARPPLPGRCGRWPKLIEMGARLHAHPNPAELTLIDPPRPFYVQWKPAPRGGHDMIRVDPEDPTAKPVKVGTTTSPSTAGVAE